jgi:hypothetical protein
MEDADHEELGEEAEESEKKPVISSEAISKDMLDKQKVKICFKKQ